MTRWRERCNRTALTLLLCLLLAVPARPAEAAIITVDLGSLAQAVQQVAHLVTIINQTKTQIENQVQMLKDIANEVKAFARDITENPLAKMRDIAANYDNYKQSLENIYKPVRAIVDPNRDAREVADAAFADSRQWLDVLEEAFQNALAAQPGSDELKINLDNTAAMANQGTAGLQDALQLNNSLALKQLVETQKAAQLRQMVDTAVLAEKQMQNQQAAARLAQAEKERQSAEAAVAAGRAALANSGNYSSWMEERLKWPQ